MRKYHRLTWIFLVAIITSCASMGVNNSFSGVEKETMIEKSREAIAKHNLRVYEEEEQEDGSYQIVAFRHEGRHFTSQEQAINRIRIILSPREDGNGFDVTIREPSKHAMSRTADSVEYSGRLLRTLNELLPQNNGTGTDG